MRDKKEGRGQTIIGVVCVQCSETRDMRAWRENGHLAKAVGRFQPVLVLVLEREHGHTPSRYPPCFVRGDKAGGVEIPIDR